MNESHLPEHEAVGGPALQDLLAGTVDKRQRHRKFVGQAGKRTDTRLVEQLFGVLVVKRLPPVHAFTAAALQIAPRERNKHTRGRTIHHPCPSGSIGRRQHPDRQPAYGTQLPGHIVPVADVERIIAGRKVGEKQPVVMAVVIPLAVEPLEVIQVRIVAAVDIVQRHDRKTESPLPVGKHQFALAHQLRNAVIRAVDGHIPKPHRGHIPPVQRLAARDHDQTVDAAEQQLPGTAVVKISTVAELHDLQPVRSAIGHRTVRSRIIADNPGIRGGPDIVERIGQQSVNHPGLQLVVGELDGNRPFPGAVTPHAAPRSEPERPVGTAHGDRHVVRGQPTASVQRDHLAPACVFMVSHRPDAVVAEPQRRIGLLAEREKEIPAPLPAPQIHGLGQPGNGGACVACKLDAVYSATDRCRPQHPGSIFVQAVYIRQLLTARQGMDASVAIGIIAHPAVAPDPQHTAPARGKGID